MNVMENIFRTYDIRGVYPSEINSELAERVAICLAKKFFDEGSVVIGHDSRIGSKELYKTVKKTLRRLGRKVIDANLITTPMLTFLMDETNAAGGIMITASHNPKEYNGIKMIKKGMIPISGVDIQKEMEK